MGFDDRRIGSNRGGLIVLAWLSCFIVSIQAETTTVLDLSYRHHVDAQTLSAAIQANLPPAADDNNDILELDISSSLLGDQYLEKVLTGLVNVDIDDDGATVTGTLHLTARTNQLTPLGVSHLVETLIANHSKNTTQNDSSSSDNNKDSTSTTTTTPISPRLTLTTLDLGWNHLHADSAGQKAFLQALQKLVDSPSLTTLRLDRCGLGPSACRSIGKAVMQRCKNKSAAAVPLSLSLCGNAATGDAGAAALAAAIRTVATESDNGITVFDELDLSACGIGDAGAQALALALEDAPGICIRHLNLSSNRISDQGAGALGRALTNTDGSSGGVGLLHLDLSNNKDIGDKGVAAIANAVAKGKLPAVALRSCHIHADGATCFGKALRTLALNNKAVDHHVSVDLSGNPLGVLRGKSKKDKDKYSASRLKSKASATAASYMNLLKKSVSPILVGPSSESDDDEERKNGEFGDEDEDNPDASLIRCGAKALASGFLDEEGETGPNEKSQRTGSSDKFHMAMRRCFFDHGAADALAAILVAAKDDLGIELTLDVELNPILEDEMLAALHGDVHEDELLREMAERHMDAMTALLESRDRASEAAKAASARMDAWEAPGGFGAPDDDVWDSDADYDDEDESYN